MLFAQGQGLVEVGVDADPLARWEHLSLHTRELRGERDPSDRDGDDLRGGLQSSGWVTYYSSSWSFSLVTGTTPCF